MEIERCGGGMERDGREKGVLKELELEEKNKGIGKKG